MKPRVRTGSSSAVLLHRQLLPQHPLLHERVCKRTRGRDTCIRATLHHSLPCTREKTIQQRLPTFPISHDALYHNALHLRAVTKKYAEQRNALRCRYAAYLHRCALLCSAYFLVQRLCDGAPQSPHVPHATRLACRSAPNHFSHTCVLWARSSLQLAEPIMICAASMPSVTGPYSDVAPACDESHNMTFVASGFG